MKRILIIPALILLSFIGKGQGVVHGTPGSLAATGNINSTSVIAGTQQAIIGYIDGWYLDTLTANGISQNIKNIPFFRIGTLTPYTTWYRDSAHKVWIRNATGVVPSQFNPIAGTNITLSGTYPNITFNAIGGGSPQGIQSVLNTSPLQNRDDSILGAGHSFTFDNQSAFKVNTTSGDITLNSFGNVFSTAGTGASNVMSTISGKASISALDGGGLNLASSAQGITLTTSGSTDIVVTAARSLLLQNIPRGDTSDLLLVKGTDNVVRSLPIYSLLNVVPNLQTVYINGSTMSQDNTWHGAGFNYTTDSINFEQHNVITGFAIGDESSNDFASFSNTGISYRAVNGLNYHPTFDSHIDGGFLFYNNHSNVVDTTLTGDSTGHLRFPFYKNNVAGDSVLSTDVNGNVKLIKASITTPNLQRVTDNDSTTNHNVVLTQGNNIQLNNLYGGGVQWVDSTSGIVTATLQGSLSGRIYNNHPYYLPNYPVGGAGSLGVLTTSATNSSISGTPVYADSSGNIDISSLAGLTQLFGDLDGGINTSGVIEVTGIRNHTIPPLSTGNLRWNGSAWVFSNTNGTITGVTAGIDLTGGGTSGTVTLNADTTTGDTKLATQGFVTRAISGGGGSSNTIYNASDSLRGNREVSGQNLYSLNLDSLTSCLLRASSGTSVSLDGNGGINAVTASGTALSMDNGGGVSINSGSSGGDINFTNGLAGSNVNLSSDGHIEATTANSQPFNINSNITNINGNIITFNDGNGDSVITSYGSNHNTILNGTLSINGGVQVHYRTVSINDNVLLSDFTIGATGNITLTLPNVSTTILGNTTSSFIFKNMDFGGSTTTTIQGDGTIDGNPDFLLAAGASVRLQSTGTSWIVVGQ